MRIEKIRLSSISIRYVLVLLLSHANGTLDTFHNKPTPRDAIDKLRPDENNGRRGLIVTNDSRAPCGDSMFHDIVIYVIGYCDNSARELLY
ncbi:hypothetical protein M8J75_016538 [Diaphorina citri]|nr:hypothetical protein M8J75_016538 [Diaphorina citri]